MPTQKKSFRTASGGQIDRSQPLHFTFDGKPYTGFAGDTLASALLANGVRLVGRSFKYHRPRGVVSAGPEEPNALVALRDGARREPNTRATVAELYEGLTAGSQNRFPSLRFDLMAVNSLLSPIFAAGFYYKTFMWPAAFWEKVYEPMIRRAAGLGRAAGVADPDQYETVTEYCDVLVIGAGPAGLAAALTAAQQGASVVLAEQDFVLGGRLRADQRRIGDKPATDWVEATIAALASLPNVRIRARTTVVGVYDGGVHAAIERVADHLPQPAPHTPRQRLWRLIAKRSILATGAIERPLVFGNNDRPGVMLAGSVRTYINRFGVLPGRNAVIFANNDDAARTAHAFHAAGGKVVALVDPRPVVSPMVQDAAEQTGARLLRGSVLRAFGLLGVTGAEVGLLEGGIRTLECDLIAMSGGWTPAVHLATNLGHKPVWNETISAFVPGALPPGMSAVGAAKGTFALRAGIDEGNRAGLEAAGVQAMLESRLTTDPDSAAMQPLWRVRGARGKSFIDFQNDVTDKDIALAEREGFRSVEHLKRYTTLGMATDQGKLSNVNGLALMAELTEKTIAETGTTTFRPPFTPVAIGALAGHARGKSYQPTRRTAAHDWAAEQGAVFVEAGIWLRAAYFPREGEADWLVATNREVRMVRDSVGICDVSTLGKIDIQGPDAVAFLERIYVNTWSTLPPGRVRYGLMLREDGFAFDDGTIARLPVAGGNDRFIVTTSTGQAGPVYRHMEYCRQVLWPELDVHLATVTDQWAQFAIAGPKSRAVLAKVLTPDLDISAAAFPPLAAVETRLANGTKARLFAISFSGELAYELAVPARYGDALARLLMQAGAEFGMSPYGLEALNVLRLEKGHPVASELNGQTTAGDLGLARMLSRKKDFIGRALAQRPALQDPARPALVGFRPTDRGARPAAGGHFVPRGVEATAANDQGHATSVSYSATLGHWIGLGLLAHGRARHGEFVTLCDPLRGSKIEVEIVSPVFFDPEGTRLHV